MNAKITTILKWTGYAIWFVGFFFFVGFIIDTNSILLALGIGFMAFAFGMGFIGLVEVLDRLDTIEKLGLTQKPVEAPDEPVFDKAVS